jgi:plastocyanin
VIVHGAYARGAELVYDPKMATVTNGTIVTWFNNDIVAQLPQQEMDLLKQELSQWALLNLL